jgi:hypothetical protein
VVCVLSAVLGAVCFEMLIRGKLVMVVLKLGPCNILAHPEKMPRFGPNRSVSRPHAPTTKLARFALPQY